MQCEKVPRSIKFHQPSIQYPQVQSLHVFMVLSLHMSLRAGPCWASNGQEYEVHSKVVESPEFASLWEHRAEVIAQYKCIHAVYIDLN